MHLAPIQVKASIHKQLLKKRTNSFLLSENTLVIIVQDCMTFACLLAVERKEIIYGIKKALGK